MGLDRLAYEEHPTSEGSYFKGGVKSSSVQVFGDKKCVKIKNFQIFFEAI